MVLSLFFLYGAILFVFRLFFFVCVCLRVCVRVFCVCASVFIYFLLLFFVLFSLLLGKVGVINNTSFQDQ